MSEKISWNFVVQALNGPSISGAGSLNSEAYETIDITVPGSAPFTKKVTLPGAMSLLIIKAPAPTTPGINITYKGTTQAIPGEPVGGYVLDGPHVFIGAGAIAFLGTATDLTFTNATAADAEIQILIGRTTA